MPGCRCEGRARTFTLARALDQQPRGVCMAIAGGDHERRQSIKIRRQRLAHMNPNPMSDQTKCRHRYRRDCRHPARGTNALHISLVCRHQKFNRPDWAGLSAGFAQHFLDFIVLLFAGDIQRGLFLAVRGPRQVGLVFQQFTNNVHMAQVYRRDQRCSRFDYPPRARYSLSIGSRIESGVRSANQRRRRPPAAAART